MGKGTHFLGHPILGQLLNYLNKAKFFDAAKVQRTPHMQNTSYLGCLRYFGMLTLHYNVSRLQKTAQAAVMPVGNETRFCAVVCQEAAELHR